MKHESVPVSTALQGSPEIYRIAEENGFTKYELIGAIHAVLCVFYEFGENGVIRDVNEFDVDRVIGIENFTEILYRSGFIDYEYDEFSNLVALSVCYDKCGRLNS